MGWENSNKFEDDKRIIYLVAGVCVGGCVSGSSTRAWYLWCCRGESKCMRRLPSQDRPCSSHRCSSWACARSHRWSTHWWTYQGRMQYVIQKQTTFWYGHTIKEEQERWNSQGPLHSFKLCDDIPETLQRLKSKKSFRDSDKEQIWYFDRTWKNSNEIVFPGSPLGAYQGFLIRIMSVQVRGVLVWHLVIY